MYVPSACLRRGSLAAVALLALVAAACGGSSSAEPATRTVQGPGFVFQAPSGAVVTRTPSSVTVRPDAKEAVELTSVTRFPLAKTFKPRLWPKAKVELDGVATRLGMGLVAKQTEPVRTVRLGSIQHPAGQALMGRRYTMEFDQNGTEVTQRLTLLLDRHTEYQLLCRWRTADAVPNSCGLLEETFARL